MTEYDHDHDHDSDEAFAPDDLPGRSPGIDPELPLDTSFDDDEPAQEA